MQKNQPILIIVGPTASGKTALAVELARQFNGEVISADSRQVYRGLDIGTGKVTAREMRGVRHHLLDVTSPRKTFTAADFVAQADRAIAGIAARRKLPIVAGGTGFYIDALTRRTGLGGAPQNPALRKKLTEKTTVQLFALLQKKDPARAAAMDTPSERNNKVRLIRALEIAEAAKGRRRGQSSPPPAPPYDCLWIGINPPFEVLEQKIIARLSQRLRTGMIAEAKRLHTTGLSYKRMEALGLEYRYLARFLQKKITRSELEQQLATEIRQYAKRQITYWKRNYEIHWVQPSQLKTVSKLIGAWLNAQEK